MAIYAILDIESNIVKNTIISDDISFVFTSENEYAVTANRAVQIGMLYDQQTNSFPGIGNGGKLLDLRDEINSLISNHQDLLLQVTHLTPEQLIIHHKHLNNLRSVASLQDYDEMESQYNLLKDLPSIPSIPVSISEQDFRNQLKIAEKILWDNPETGTLQQKAVINTMKLDFPFTGIETIRDELDLLESLEVIGVGRADEIYNSL